MNGHRRQPRPPAAARNLLLALLVSIAASVAGAAPAASVQIDPGRLYGPGDVLTEPSLGLLLTMPNGWRGRLAPDGESFQMEPTAGGAFMVVIADELTAEEARVQMAQPQDLGDGIVLTPTSEVREIASGHFSAEYQPSGPAAGFAASVDVRTTQTGLGVAFVLLSPPDAVDTHRETMRAFAFGLGVSERPAPAATASAAGGDAWEPYLRGMYMARYFTRTGYTESTELWLCSDGTFRYDSQGGGFGGGASGAIQGTGQGRWSATGVGATGTLTLTFSTGAQRALNLSYDYEQGRLFVDGDRWLRGQNDYCS